MRGADEQPGAMFSYVSLEDAGAGGSSVAGDPAHHRSGARSGCRRSSARCISSSAGRRLPPEKLLRALLLQALYTIRSERQLMEQLDYNLLFRWFVGLGMDDAVWSPTTFTKNRDRLLDGRHRRGVLRRGGDPRADRSGCCRTSTSRWTARCSRPGRVTRAFGPAIRIRRRPGGGNPTREFPWAAARPMTRISRRPIPMRGSIKKARGREAQLGYLGHVLMEHRSGLIVKRWSRRRTATANATPRW